jgi:hypothetical protein
MSYEYDSINKPLLGQSPWLIARIMPLRQMRQIKPKFASCKKILKESQIFLARNLNHIRVLGREIRPGPPSFGMLFTVTYWAKETCFPVLPASISIASW